MEVPISPLLALITPHSQLTQRDLGGSETATLLVTATAPAPTVTATATSTQTPQQPVSNAISGPTSSPLLFIILITILGTTLFIGIGIAAYCCATRKSRRLAREATAGNELQPTTTTVQPAVQSEVYGYYAPGARGGGGGGTTEQEAAARELYGYFSPTVAPRAGDGVVDHPAAGAGT
ncbi:hypothetical protein N431DRAFT_476069 [Stipitochalara longipes BDJ]|nr:hypothetical protein N431DRAFT_476069 [Stipitochalara longipes BDJ]